MKSLGQIMLVDDDRDTNFYNKIVLKQYIDVEEIIDFQNGKEALTYIIKEQHKVDLIFLDVNMPVMNGWQFLEEYEKLKQEKKPPIVIMLSSSVNYADKKHAERFNSVKKYINKPLSPEVIKEISALFNESSK